MCVLAYVCLCVFVCVCVGVCPASLVFAMWLLSKQQEPMVEIVGFYSRIHIYLTPCEFDHCDGLHTLQWEVGGKVP